MSCENPLDPDRNRVASDELLSIFWYEPDSGRYKFDRPGGFQLVSIYSFPFHGPSVFYRRTLSAGCELVRLPRLICQWMGCDTKGLVVHHVNNDPFDNRWLNLELLTPSAHSSLHAALGRGDLPRPVDWVEWKSRPELELEFSGQFDLEFSDEC